MRLNGLRDLLPVQVRLQAVGLHVLHGLLQELRHDLSELPRRGQSMRVAELLQRVHRRVRCRGRARLTARPELRMPAADPTVKSIALIAPVVRYAEADVPTEYGALHTVVYRVGDAEPPEEHVALVVGDVASGFAPVLTQIGR